MQTAVPAWWSVIIQVLSALVSVIAIISFVRTNQKTKNDQAEAMMEMSHSVKAVADAQLRTDGKVDEHIAETNKMKDAMWKRIDEVKEKQTTLCALHTVNHPGQQI